MKQNNANWPVDAHVHFHSAAAVGPTLDAAARNFRAVAGRPGRLLGAILLTQASRERVFEWLQRVPEAGGWKISGVADEPASLVASRDGAEVAIVCGRQVRAADGLEVLALGTTDAFPDGLPFEEAIVQVRRSGALTVLPWGFGKWLGARGERVERAIAAADVKTLFLGDNGSRLASARLPSILREARDRGFRLLPGTDPFPFAGGYRRVGGFGFLADIEPSRSAPWRDLRAWLDSCRESPRAYGRATGPVRFVVNQVGIQLYQRLGRSRAA